MIADCPKKCAAGNGCVFFSLTGKFVGVHDKLFENDCRVFHESGGKIHMKIAVTVHLNLAKRNFIQKLQENWDSGSEHLNIHWYMAVVNPV